ncbi:MAG: Na+/H+ antiporter subunit E [Gammaproteobacteria bacterium]|uniref:Na+/H+ antiporter subunit E n=1 Tax=Rhodoferax sp. TaxID=50421 RepID=UPI0017A2C494|nr:Na+/H+ antiporter subunit E [Rhodoferax sp.]MBU3897638.1 Na+/H+ antiporter subunit E [Gammaproteobacteria bacterium]MBA3058264.1 Na+/H+ antiporter subunit E [Rhodoferax sp.]MBU3999457.1 Na+/H+ antiporter subunit E [Gammaproteobacteria bacterium]MBU4017718.1 Na+/H+ antiporter subunit E [Gammaproteobacteria bacterium]MBU4081161.1 Na+/H+ antiporter subunit E [Gammaproteobacteria bacterium]
MKRWLPHPLLTPVLALIWLLLNNSASVGQLVLGLLLGWAIPLFTLAFWPERVRLSRPFSMLRFLRFFLYDVLIANLTVARLVLVGPRALNPVFVQVPLDLRNELAISLLANTTCLTPGTVSARLSEDRRFLLVHALDCTDPQALIDTIKTRFEAPLKEIFEC